MLIDLKLLGLVSEFKFKQEAQCFALTQREENVFFSQANNTEACNIEKDKTTLLEWKFRAGKRKA